MQAKLYTLSARVLPPAYDSRIIWQYPGTKTLNLDTIPISAPGTAAEWVTIYSVARLTAGRQYLRMLAETGGFKVNWFDFRSGDVMPRARITGLKLDPEGTTLEMTCDKDLKPYPVSALGFAITVDGEPTGIKNVMVKPCCHKVVVISLNGSIGPPSGKAVLSYSGGYIRAFDNTPLQDTANAVIFDFTPVVPPHYIRTPVNIFPNPASHEITIETSFRFQRIDILDTNGRVVMTETTKAEVQNGEPLR